MHGCKKIETICRYNSISTPFDKHTENSITRAQTPYRLNMSSISQNLPRTFYKLADKWNKKVGAMNYESKCWTLGSPDNQDPIQRVARMMSHELGRDPTTLAQRFSDMAADFSRRSNTTVECNLTPSGQVWIYDMRQSDALPKSQAETERLYKFVRVLISQWFSAEAEWYLAEKNIHIAVCFFVWYFTKPNFFYKDNVMKQTTRYGIQRVWTPLLLGKKMKLQAPANASAPKSQLSTTTDALLPKQLQQQAKCQKDIVALLEFTTLSNTSLEWEDPRRLHLKLSECMANTDSGLSIKHNKKLQKIYHEYTTVTTKINKTMEKINKAQRANAKIVTQQKEPVWARELGTPPASPTVLIRQSACEAEPCSPTELPECLGCSTGQANQLAHMGGCLPDELEAAEEEEDDVPDSWEDL